MQGAEVDVDVHPVLWFALFGAIVLLLAVVAMYGLRRWMEEQDRRNDVHTRDKDDEWR